jgi:hypothetical protein
VYCMIVVNERCGILGGVVLLGLCCCRWGRGGSSGGVQVFCAPRICGRNQVDQNSVYGDSECVLNSIGGTVNCTYVWCWRTLEQAVLYVGIMSARSWRCVYRVRV